MLRYTDSIFIENYVRSIAVDYRSKPNLVQRKFAKICIFDPPGNEEYSTLTPAYWHFVEIIVYIASYDDPDSFNFIKTMDNIIFEEAKSKAKRLFILNKEDLKESLGKDAIEIEEETKIWTDDKKIKFFICSAKENRNITESIDSIVNELVLNKGCDEDINKELKQKKSCEIL